jgi:hypothetical protein
MAQSHSDVFLKSSPDQEHVNKAGHPKVQDQQSPSEVRNNDNKFSRTRLEEKTTNIQQKLKPKIVSQSSQQLDPDDQGSSNKRSRTSFHRKKTSCPKLSQEDPRPRGSTTFFPKAGRAGPGHHPLLAHVDP